MTKDLLKSNSTMCCCGEGRRRDPLLLLLSLFSLASSQAAAAEAAELHLPFTSCFYFSLLSLSQSGWREAGRHELFPSGKQRPAGGPSKQQLCHPSGSAWWTQSRLSIYRTHSSFEVIFLSLISQLFLFAPALLGAVCSVDQFLITYVWTRLGHQRSFSMWGRCFWEEAAWSNMSLMVCHWEQNNFTMKLVGWTLPGHDKGQAPEGTVCVCVLLYLLLSMTLYKFPVQQDF